MRGNVGDKLTIYGDWLYDWSKLYQSLIGYDKILHDKYNNRFNSTYETTMLTFFKNYFIKLFSVEHWNNLQIITKSLLFTLLPLHNNEKCINYFNSKLTCSIFFER